MAAILYDFYHATNFSLCGDVGARLDIGLPSATTTPTLVQVKGWLNLAQLDIVSKAANDAVPSLWAEQQITGGTLTEVHANIDGFWRGNLADDFIRPVEVQYWRAASDAGALSRDRLYSVQMLSKEMSMAFVNNSLYAPSTGRLLCWFWNDKIFLVTVSTEVKFTNDRVWISYIKEPVMLVAIDSQTELPGVFQEYMVQFAVIRAKLQDGKIEELPALTAAYEQGIQLINMQAAQSYYGIRGR